MNQVRAAALQPKAVSAGILWLVGTAITLTQLTSLALGPSASRQLNVSVAVPAVDIEDASSSIGTQVDAVLGALVTAGPVRAQQGSVDTPSTSSSVRTTGGRAVTAPAATIFVSKSSVATARERSVTAGHSGHDDRGHERGRAKVPATD
jgi:hypothetical protein